MPNLVNDEWDAAYRLLASSAGSADFADRWTFNSLVEYWKALFEDDDNDQTVMEFLRARLESDEWVTAYELLASSTSSPNFPSRETFDLNVEDWKAMYEDDDDDQTVVEFLRARLAFLVRINSDLGPFRVIRKASQPLPSDTDEWVAAYKLLASSTDSPDFPDRETFDRNVENWKAMYEDDDDDRTVMAFLRARLAAVVRLSGPIGPVRVIRRPRRPASPP